MVTDQSADNSYKKQHHHCCSFLGGSATGVKVASARLPSPKTLVGSPAQILAQFPKQQSPKQLQQSAPLGASSVSQSHTTSTSPVSKPTIQIKQESGRSDQFYRVCFKFCPMYLVRSYFQRSFLKCFRTVRLVFQI